MVRPDGTGTPQTTFDMRSSYPSLMQTSVVKSINQLQNQMAVNKGISLAIVFLAVVSHRLSVECQPDPKCAAGVDMLLSMKLVEEDLPTYKGLCSESDAVLLTVPGDSYWSREPYKTWYGLMKGSKALRQEVMGHIAFILDSKAVTENGAWWKLLKKNKIENINMVQFELKRNNDLCYKDALTSLERCTKIEEHVVKFGRDPNRPIGLVQSSSLPEIAEEVLVDYEKSQRSRPRPTLPSGGATGSSGSHVPRGPS